MTKKVIALLFVGLLIAVAAPANAAIYTMDFTNATLDLGMNSQIDLSNQYDAFGLNFQYAYRYIDPRDPFDQFGVANDLYHANNQIGIIYFSELTSFVDFHWVTINSQNMVVEAYAADNSLLDVFSQAAVNDPDFGFGSVSGAGISYLKFHDGSGAVALSDLTYERNVVPEPATMTLLGLGLLGAAFVLRFRK